MFTSCQGCPALGSPPKTRPSSKINFMFLLCAGHLFFPISKGPAPPEGASAQPLRVLAPPSTQANSLLPSSSWRSRRGREALPETGGTTRWTRSLGGHATLRRRARVQIGVLLGCGLQQSTVDMWDVQWKTRKTFKKQLSLADSYYSRTLSKTASCNSLKRA